MANKYRKPPADLVRSSIELTKRVAMLETKPRAIATAINSGHFKYISDNGVTMVDFGDLGPGLGPGWIFRRGEGGQPAFYLGGNQPTGTQFWRLVDNSGNDIMTDDAQSGQGLARPYIPYNTTLTTQVTGTPAAQTSSTSFIPAYYVRGIKQHPIMQWEYSVTCPATGTCEVQLVDTSFGSGSPVIAGPVSYPANAFQFSSLVGALNGSHMNPVSVELQYRLASGTGSVGLTSTWAYGRQS